MFKQKKKKINGKTVSVIDGTRAPYTQFGVGVVKGNPKTCLFCHKPIRKGETWAKHTSEKDPKWGRYSVIVHSRCSASKV